MKFAVVGGMKSEAQPKLRGTCINCQSEMVAKCGRVKIWHWAHKGFPPCDPWWENETNWHRAWKDKFPTEWQEFVCTDKITGEKHIADVRSPHGLVIEFQHSVINPSERKSREDFYGDMVWVVDGLRGELDEGHFKVGLSGPVQEDPLVYQVNWWGRSRLLHNWGEAGAKVYLDFGKELLWRLVFFDSKKKVGVVGPIPRSTFISDCLKGAAIGVGKLNKAAE